MCCGYKSPIPQNPANVKYKQLYYNCLMNHIIFYVKAVDQFWGGFRSSNSPTNLTSRVVIAHGSFCSPVRSLKFAPCYYIFFLIARNSFCNIFGSQKWLREPSKNRSPALTFSAKGFDARNQAPNPRMSSSTALSCPDRLLADWN